MLKVILSPALSHIRANSLVKCIKPPPLSFERLVHTTATTYFKDYYEILAVPRNASQQDIKTAYYEKAKVHHPDTNKSSTGSLRFQEISEAYEILGDINKRRAYDSTTGIRGTHFNRTNNEPDPVYRARPAQNISMSHIHQVYRALNKEEKEEPVFRIFEDHTYPGTDFNRFEYTRHWNSESKQWVYQKRTRYDRAHYEKKSADSIRIVRTCISIVMFGALFYVVSYRFLLRNLSRPKSKNTSDMSTGLYVINTDGSFEVHRGSINSNTR